MNERPKGMSSNWDAGNPEEVSMKFFDAERRQCEQHMAERSSEKGRENSQEMQRPNLKASPKVGVGVVVVFEGQVLLGKRKGAHGAGCWSFGGGHLEFGETVEECAKRELEEETGLKATSVILGPWTNDLIEGSKHYVTLFVFVEHFTGELTLKEPDKCEGWHWFAWNKLPTPLFPPVANLIQKMGIEELTRFTSSLTKKSD